MSSEEEARGGPDAAHEAAIDWWVREKAGELEGARRAEFSAWLAADSAHGRAYADIAGMFAQAQKLRPAPPRRARARAVRGAAAALLAASLALLAGFDDLAILLRADHRSAIGERKTATLADGSRVVLDGGSAIAIHFEAGQRRVALLEGEAWFEVAPDAARPFVVEAAGGTITALGTAFDVALETKGARVGVGAHSVAVTSGGGRVVVAERQETSFAAGAPALSPTPVAAEALGAFRRGALVIEDRPLGEALAALGRQRRGFVYCLRAATCARRVTGVFSTADPLGALREIEFFLGLRAVHLTNYLILLIE